MDSFFNEVKKFVNLDAEAKEAFSKIMVYHEFSKGHILVKPNSVCNYIYFIESGLTRTFYEKDEKDVTDWLSSENTFACCVVSFINRVPDRRGIELLEDTKLWAIQYYELEELYREYHAIERMGRLIVSFGLTQLQQRFDDLHFSTAADRYKKMMEQTPSLLQRAPLNVIASYLGISQETLSRMRARYMLHTT